MLELLLWLLLLLLMLFLFLCSTNIRDWNNQSSCWLLFAFDYGHRFVTITWNLLQYLCTALIHNKFEPAFLIFIFDKLFAWWCLCGCLLLLNCHRPFLVWKSSLIATDSFWRVGRFFAAIVIDVVVITWLGFLRNPVVAVLLHLLLDIGTISITISITVNLRLPLWSFMRLLLLMNHLRLLLWAFLLIV